MTASLKINSVSIYDRLKSGLKGFVCLVRIVEEISQDLGKCVFLRTQQNPFKDLKTHIILDYQSMKYIRTVLPKVLFSRKNSPYGKRVYDLIDLGNITYYTFTVQIFRMQVGIAKSLRSTAIKNMFSLNFT